VPGGDFLLAASCGMYCLTFRRVAISASCMAIGKSELIQLVQLLLRVSRTRSASSEPKSPPFSAPFAEGDEHHRRAGAHMAQPRLVLSPIKKG